MRFELESALMASDAKYGLRENRHSFGELGAVEPAGASKMDNYQRLAIFGSFVLGQHDSDGYLMVCENTSDDDQTLSSILHIGQKGLDLLHSTSTPKICRELTRSGIADVEAGTLAREMFDESSFEEPVMLAGAVEVYENLNDKSLIPIFTFNNRLKDLSFRARHQLPAGVDEDTSGAANQLLADTEQTRKALAIEAVVDLTLDDVAEYDRAA